MTRVHQLAVLVAASVAVLAGIVALAAAAWTGDRDCETVPDALDAGVGHQVCGGFLARYRAEGGQAGLGLPVSDERPVTLASARPHGDRELSFSRGTVYLDRRTGETSVGRWYAYVPLP